MAECKLYSCIMYVCICIYIYIGFFFAPGTCLSSISSLGPSKTRSFPIKARVIWVPGIIMPLCFIFQILRPPGKTPTIPAVSKSLSSVPSQHQHIWPLHELLEFSPRGYELVYHHRSSWSTLQPQEPHRVHANLNGPY